MIVHHFLKNPSIPLRVRKKVQKVVGKPTPGQAFEAPMFEYTYHGITGNHQDDKIYLYGMHEPATIRFLRAALMYQTGIGITPIYADIGTNMGQHLIAVCGCTLKAFGFEPWDVVRARAQAQVERNALSHVQIFPFGLSDGEAELPFIKPTNDNLGTGMFSQNGTDVLQVRRGDDVFEGAGVMPSVLKIDTEGFEDKVLRGLSSTIAAARPVIVFEYGAQTRTILDGEGGILAVLPDGYRLFGLLPSREYPAIQAFSSSRKFENIIAWPYEEDPKTVLGQLG